MKRHVSILLPMIVLMIMGLGCGGGDSGGSGSDADDNFRLLISDENNAIEDFSELWVTITGIGVHRSGECEDGDEGECDGDGEWLQLSPENAKVNLRELTGENATTIWSGDLEPGKYTKVFIYVSEVRGILADDPDRSEVELQLPSNKLQISKPFEVEEGVETNFVYDITVIQTGNGRYKILPQIGESGPGVPFAEVDDDSDEDVDDTDDDQESEDLELRLTGEITAGASVILSVMDNGQPLAGASVTINGQSAGQTGADGTLGLTLPAGEEEIEIKAVLGDKEGELEFDFEDGEE